MDPTHILETDPTFALFGYESRFASGFAPLSLWLEDSDRGGNCITHDYPNSSVAAPSVIFWRSKPTRILEEYSPRDQPNPSKGPV